MKESHRQTAICEKKIRKMRNESKKIFFSHLGLDGIKYLSHDRRCADFVLVK